VHLGELVGSKQFLLASYHSLLVWIDSIQVCCLLTSAGVLKFLGMARPSGHAVSLNLFWQLTCLVILTTCFLTSWHLRTFMSVLSILTFWHILLQRSHNGGLGHAYPCKKKTELRQYQCLYLTFSTTVYI